MIDAAVASLAEIVALGGPVVLLLAALSVVALAVILHRLWVFAQAGVGRRAGIDRALDEQDAGRGQAALAALRSSSAPIAAILAAAITARPTPAATERVDTMAEAELARLEGGFRLLDAIAQTAPLLGLFGTVLGMIEAFQAMQGAGTTIDPSVLAGGIWVALLTTAAGLAVAIPTGLFLGWLEARLARERTWLAAALARARSPDGMVAHPDPVATGPARLGAAYA